MEAFINYLLQFGHLNQQQIDLVKSKGIFKELKKDEYYHEAGKIPREIAFLTEGIFRIWQRRYSTSKLCNILTTYELQKRPSKTNITENAFDPGMVPGTGLARTYPPLLRFV